MREAERRAVDLRDRDDRDRAPRQRAAARATASRVILASVRGEHHGGRVARLDVEAAAMERHQRLRWATGDACRPRRSRASLPTVGSTTASGAPRFLSSSMRHQ